MRKKLVVANWKMNPRTLSDADDLLKAYSTLLGGYSAEVVVCPQLVFLQAMVKSYKDKFAFSAQDCFWEDQGAFTGEISPPTLKSLGVNYVLLGHSERRKYLGETDTMVSKKLTAATRSGLMALLCLGGGLHKKTGELTIKTFVTRQFSEVTRGLKQARSLVCIYEPAWAISTFSARPVSATHIESMSETIRGCVKRRFGSAISSQLKVLYGGNVKASNVEEIFSAKNLDGALVGAASLIPREFKKVIQAIET